MSDSRSFGGPHALMPLGMNGSRSVARTSWGTSSFNSSGLSNGSTRSLQLVEWVRGVDFEAQGGGSVGSTRVVNCLREARRKCADQSPGNPRDEVVSMATHPLN